LPTEASIAVLALIGLGLMFALRQPEPPAMSAAAGAASQPQPVMTGPVPEGDATAEQLNRTRFQ
jgi:hypothetical protein